MTKLQNIYVKGSASQRAGAVFVCALLAFVLALIVSPSFAWAEPEAGSSNSSSEISTAANTITVPAPYDGYTDDLGLSVTVTYDPSFETGKTTRFAFNVTGGGDSELRYKINSLEHKISSGWISMVDPSKGDAKDWTDKNYFEDVLSSPGEYKLSFLVGLGQLFPNGNVVPTKWARFKISFTVPPTGGKKTVDEIADNVAAQCKKECTAKNDTSQFAQALWLHDWIVDNTEYSNDYRVNSAEGVFCRGKSACEGYHAAYVMLLSRVGIETRRVDWANDHHVWTGVKIDGKWYNVDATWDDPAYSYSDGLNLRHLYFAIPNSVMKFAHEDWDGTYWVDYSSRAPFEANSYTANYFIKTGEIAKYTEPYKAASGTYSIKAKLAAKESAFTLPLGNYTWEKTEKAMLYSLVAYQLSQEDWGNNIRLSVSYENGALVCQAEYPVDIADAQVADVEAVIYSGKAVKPLPEVKLGGKTLQRNKDYTLSYRQQDGTPIANPVNAGTYEVVISGIDNYAGTVKKTFTISKLDLSKVGIDAPAGNKAGVDFVAGGVKPTPKVRTGDVELNSSNFVYSYSGNTKVGTATLTVTARGNNCYGSKTIKFEIIAAQIPKPSLSTTNIYYNGNPQKPVVVKDGSTTLKEGTDYSITYKNNVNLGTATATVTGKGNYKGTSSINFTIKEKPSTSSGGNASSGGTAATPPAAATPSGDNASVTPSKPAAVTTQPKPQTQSVAGIWKKSGGKWWFAYDTKTQTAQNKQWPVNEWVTIQGKSYHFDSAGYMHANWQKLNNKWYYFASDGAMRTGWQKISGKWYYLHTDGIMRTGKINPGDGKTYYLNPSSGAMKTGWNKEGSGWYYYAGSGAMAKGWTKVGGKWYYLNTSTGLMQTGFYKVGTTWYYSNGSGVMLTGWQKISGKYYYFNGSGAMQFNKWIGNYWVKDNGVMATSERVDGGKYYVDGSGKWVRGK